eukprot:4873498-Karenia_brevis.AAC.1
MSYLAKVVPECDEKVRDAIDMDAIERKARRLGLCSKLYVMFKPEVPGYVKFRAKKEFNNLFEEREGFKINDRV